jgi:hypothetical protein
MQRKRPQRIARQSRYRNRFQAASQFLAYSGAASYQLGRAASRLRAVFEFVVPLGFSISTLWTMLRFVPKPFRH